ncbi:hypothetical protein BIY23_02140 [Wolbachia pipientis]|uniref:Uncharacterized protein n=2 Tax=Wolbachia pipientis TaxID=955 RepID=A0A1E7QK18_WOLPI|nr:hypothetical protein BIY23_02140 [Wolbachia pipientis]
MTENIALCDALIKAFRINNLNLNDMFTNFKQEKLNNRFFITNLFGENIERKEQCAAYLQEVALGIDRLFHKSEHTRISKFFDYRHFPFNFDQEVNIDKKTNMNKKVANPYDGNNDRFYSKIPVSTVIPNLESHLAHAVIRGIEIDYDFDCDTAVVDTADSGTYIAGCEFATSDIAKEFARQFVDRINTFYCSSDHARSEWDSSDIVSHDGRRVYIKKGVFHDVEFVESVAKNIAHETTRHMYMQECDTVKEFKGLLTQFISLSTGLKISHYHVFRDDDDKDEHGVWSENSCILVPVIQDSTGDLRYTKLYEADAINRAFRGVNGEVKDPIVSDVKGHAQPVSQELLNECDKIYGMVLSNMNTAYYLIDTVLENAEVSKLDKKYGLTIDPNAPHLKELFIQNVVRIRKKMQEEQVSESQAPQCTQSNQPTDLQEWYLENLKKNDRHRMTIPLSSQRNKHSIPRPLSPCPDAMFSANLFLKTSLSPKFPPVQDSGINIDKKSSDYLNVPSQQFGSSPSSSGYGSPDKDSSLSSSNLTNTSSNFTNTSTSSSNLINTSTCSDNTSSSSGGLSGKQQRVEKKISKDDIVGPFPIAQPWLRSLSQSSRDDPSCKTSSSRGSQDMDHPINGMSGTQRLLSIITESSQNSSSQSSPQTRRNSSITDITESSQNSSSQSSPQTKRDSPMSGSKKSNNSEDDKQKRSGIRSYLQSILPSCIRPQQQSSRRD